MSSRTSSRRTQPSSSTSRLTTAATPCATTPYTPPQSPSPSPSPSNALVSPCAQRRAPQPPTWSPRRSRPRHIHMRDPGRSGLFTVCEADEDDLVSDDDDDNDHRAGGSRGPRRFSWSTLITGAAGCTGIAMSASGSSSGSDDAESRGAVTPEVDEDDEEEDPFALDDAFSLEDVWRGINLDHVDEELFAAAKSARSASDNRRDDLLFIHHPSGTPPYSLDFTSHSTLMYHPPHHPPLRSSHPSRPSRPSRTVKQPPTRPIRRPPPLDLGSTLHPFRTVTTSLAMPRPTTTTHSHRNKLLPALPIVPTSQWQAAGRQSTTSQWQGQGAPSRQLPSPPTTPTHRRRQVQSHMEDERPGHLGLAPASSLPPTPVNLADALRELLTTCGEYDLKNDSFADADSDMDEDEREIDTSTKTKVAPHTLSLFSTSSSAFEYMQPPTTPDMRRISIPCPPLRRHDRYDRQDYSMRELFPPSKDRFVGDHSFLQSLSASGPAPTPAPPTPESSPASSLRSNSTTPSDVSRGSESSKSTRRHRSLPRRAGLPPNWASAAFGQPI